MNPSRHLGPRLNCLFELVMQVQLNNACSYIWDCCCDHGYLGIKILSENLCEKLIFVDQLPHVIQQLANKLAPFCIENHELIAADAGDLCFDKKQSHLVILAGIGGETTVEIVNTIEHNHPDVQIEYIFCPSASQSALRKYLADKKFALIFETLVCENRRYYEVIHVKRKGLESGLPCVSPNCNMWDEHNVDHQRYLTKISAPRVSKKNKRKKVHFERDI